MTEVKYITDPNKIEVVHCAGCEKETSITMCREEGTAHIFTTENPMLTKIKKLMAAQPETWKCWEGSRDKDGNVTGYFFEVPYKAIQLRNKKIVSDELRAAASLRMRKRFGTDDSDDFDDED